MDFPIIYFENICSLIVCWTKDVECEAARWEEKRMTTEGVHVVKEGWCNKSAVGSQHWYWPYLRGFLNKDEHWCSFPNPFKFGFFVSAIMKFTIYSNTHKLFVQSFISSHCYSDHRVTVVSHFLKYDSDVIHVVRLKYLNAANSEISKSVTREEKRGLESYKATDIL